MEDGPALRELADQTHESQVDILVLRDTLALLIARLAASGIVEKSFVDDLSVCLDGLDFGRDTAVQTAAPQEMQDDLVRIQRDVRASRTRLFAFIDGLIDSFRR